MTIISKIGNLMRKNYNFFTLFDTKVLRIQKLNPLFLISFLIVFSSLSLGVDYRDIKPALRKHFIDLFMASGTDCTLSKRAIKLGQRESAEIVEYYTGYID